MQYHKILTIFTMLFLAGFCLANAVSSFTITSDNGYGNDANVLLAISVEDGNRMQFSCSGASWSTLETYATSKYFDLNSGLYGCAASNGLRTLYIKAEYTDGNYSSGSHDANIILDFISPVVTSFSPSDEIIPGDGKNGQAISVTLTDDINLSTISFSLDRASTDVYDNKTTKCTITGTSKTCSFTDLDVDRGASYTYTYIVTDMGGNTFTDTNTFSFTDSVAPSAPTGLIGTDTNINIDLNWANNSENDLNSYAIYRLPLTGFDCNSETFVAYSDTNGYSDTGLDENTTYYYKIKAIDWTGNFSSCSDQNSFTTDYNFSSGPTITRTDVSCATNTWCYDNTPTFSFAVTGAEYSWLWTTSSDTNPSDCNYGSDCNTTSTTTLTSLDNGTSYFKVKSCKPTGCSPTSAFTLKIDSTSPNQPSPTLTLVGNDVNVKWAAVTDSGGSGMYRYYIYRSTSSTFSVGIGNQLGYVADGNLFYYDDSPFFGETYYYKVLAMDIAGNYSSDYNAPKPSITIPTDYNLVKITIETYNKVGKKTKYFNTAEDFNMEITFSRTVNDFNLYKTIDDVNTTVVSNQDGITSYNFDFTTSANYTDINFFLEMNTDVNKVIYEYHLYFDNTAPAVSFNNITEGQTITDDYSIEINTSDNYEIYKIEVYLDDILLGEAVDLEEADFWRYILTASNHNSGTLKVIAYDGVGLTATTDANIIIDYTPPVDENTILPPEEITLASVVEKMNAAFAKKDEIEEKLANNPLYLDQGLKQEKELADALLAEAETYLETNLELANQKAVEAFNKYASIIQMAEGGALNILPVPPELNDFILVIVLVIVIAISLFATIFLMKKKGLWLFDKTPIWEKKY